MRTHTDVDAIAEAHVQAEIQHSPIAATYMGVPGSDHLLDDFSPEGIGRWADVVRKTLSELDAATPADACDEVTIAAMRDRLGLELETFEAGDHERDLNNIASPLQGIRDIFDLMPTDTPEDWETIARRMQAVPGALEGYRETLRQGVANGRVPAARQVEVGIKQATDYGRAEGFFHELAERRGEDDGLRSELQRAASAAAVAYSQLARFLADEVAPYAPQEDAVGPEFYQRQSRLFVGAAVDLDETYEWGVAALRELREEQAALAAEIAGDGASVADAVAALDGDPAQQLHGADALREWMQTTSDEAIEKLDGTHFDVPEKLRQLECRIAPTATGAIYYTGPTEDFSRPGRMWWSVPEGTDTFTVWRETTTVYHEGVPGHHLQVGQAVHNAADLNRWRRNLFVSGHGEGWALYAERLMDEFGMLDRAARFGMLDSQILRAVRVVIDLGVHLRKPAFDEYGGGTWDHDKAWGLLSDTVNMDEGFLRFELTRYLGWPGQAPSYRIGQRIWEQIRDEQARSRGQEFSLKDFHTRALDLGGLPLDVLRQALA